MCVYDFSQFWGVGQYRCAPFLHPTGVLYTTKHKHNECHQKFSGKNWIGPEFGAIESLSETFHTFLMANIQYP